MSTSPQQLSNKDVAKVAALARLALSPAEVEKMAGELSKIVGFVSMLGEIETGGVEPLAHPLDTHNVFRDDVPRDSLPRAAAFTSTSAPASSCPMKRGG